MWESPIDISPIVRENVIRESAKDLKKETDEHILKAITEVGINKEELIKCMDCEKRSYDKGYEEGSIKVIDKFLKCLEEYVTYGYDHLTYSKIADLAERFKKELKEDYREQKLKKIKMVLSRHPYSSTGIDYQVDEKCEKEEDNNE